MIKFRSIIYDFFAVSAIGIIVLLIYLTNFRGNFWISGWDNLHPELNFGANIARAFFSSWQEYQGLGLPAGHGHATELLREIILWFINIFLPAVDSRKIYLISMLLTGALGMYFFIRNVLLKEVHYQLRVILSFIAESFYLLNLMTLQIFYIPYEAFAAHFAFLPWMIYSLYIFMRSPSKKNFLIFLAIQLLGTWQFYIPTLFIVYFFIAFVISLSIAIQSNFRKTWTILLLTLLGILVVNLYWGLPFAYYTLTNLSSQQQAYINLLYTADAYTQNLQFGSLQNAALFKSFLFNNVAFTNNQGLTYMLGAWREYANQWYFLLIGYSLFTVSILGVIQAIRKKKHLFLALLFALFFGFIAIKTFPFNLINDFLRSSPLLDQVFRNPFTKFANAALFFMIIFFTYGLLQIINALQSGASNHIKIKLLIPLGVLLGYLVLINIYIFPLWKGNFIYAPLKTTIPNEYFQTFNFFADQGNGRIANLPQFTPSGWDYYKWGYQGSGFIWYGINQPILDRAFDVWSKYDENYYWEISQAIYSENLPNFEKILEKYQINWLLVDENITTPGTSKILYTKNVEAMLNSSGKVHLAHQFGNIKIYKVNLKSNPNNFVFITGALPNIEPAYTWNDNDQGYLNYGNYVNKINIQNNTNVLYPFRSLFTGRDQNDLEFNLKETDNNFILEAKIPKQFYNSELSIPALSKEESTEIDKNDLTKTTAKNPELFINDTKIPVRNYATGSSLMLNLDQKIDYSLKILVPKIYGYYGNPAVTSSNLSKITPSDCNQFNKGDLSIDKLKDSSELLRLTSTHSNNCLDYNLPNLTQNLAYLLSIPARNIQGKSLLVSIDNNGSKREDMAIYLPSSNKPITSYLVIPPKERYGLGYTIHLDNISLDSTKTTNELGEIKISPFPYAFLSSIKFTNGNNVNSLNSSAPNVIHESAYYYKVSFENSLQNQTLILSQAYDQGWHAYFLQNGNILTKLLPFFGTELKSHVIVNNWENGWILDGKERDGNLVLIYLPQYFEFLGFAVFLISFVGVLLAFLASRVAQKGPPRFDL
jgi:hypothetical protein